MIYDGPHEMDSFGETQVEIDGRILAIFWFLPLFVYLLLSFLGWSGG
jgi:hypothetical protein